MNETVSTSRPLDGIDLNLLVTLRALVEASSVTVAANELGTTQPTVSRALGTLRHVFGDPLLVRSGRGMALTPFAKALREPLERTLGAVDRLRTVGAFDPQRDERHFRLLIPDVIGSSLVPTLLTALEGAPAVTFEVHGSEREALDGLLRGEVDLMVGVPALDHPELMVRRFAHGMSWSAMFGRRHPAWRDGLTRQSWLSSAHLQLIPGGRAEAPGHVDTFLTERGDSRRVVARVAYLAAVGPMLERSRLVTSLPTPACHWIARGHRLRVVPHPLVDELGELDLRSTWHTAHQADAGHRWLRATVHRCMEAFLES